MNIRERDSRFLAGKPEYFREVDETAEKGRKFKDFKYAWHNQGVWPDGSRIGENGRSKGGTVKDALAMWEAPLFMPRVINESVMEAVEPMLIASSLLEKIPYVVGSTIIDIPVMGAVDGDFDVGEEESYPEIRIYYGTGTEVSKIGKQGVAVKFTDEVLRYATFDVVTMHLRQAARALARNKEEKIFNMWYNVAKTSHDNKVPGNSVFGSTTGRDLTGAQNGTLTMDDIFEMYATVLQNGYQPDTLLVHPLTWLMFIQDSQLRAFAQASGGPWFGSQWTGSPSRNDFPSVFGGEGISGGKQRGHPAYPVNHDGDGNDLDKSLLAYSQNLTSAPVIPNYLGIPFRVLVSPFVPYDVENNTTSILMADSSQMGYLIEEHGIQSSEWTDEETDIYKVKLTERFTLRDKNRGYGLAIAKNIVVGSNQINLPAQAQIGVAGSIDLADRLAAVP